MAETPRHELKYFIATRDAPVLAGRLERMIWRDPHAGPNGEYSIRSLYFDDAQNSAYQDKLAGVMHRDKYRLRIYNLSDRAIFLERKRKMGDLIQKSSVRVTRRLAEQMISGDPRGLEQANAPLLRDMYVQMRTMLLRPCVLVDYDREAFLHPAENVRITLDKRVRTGLTSLDLFGERVATVPVLDPGRTILEVKFDRYLPDFIAPVLSLTPAERSAISKYVHCRGYAV